jgi:hypothetical protein
LTHQVAGAQPQGFHQAIGRFGRHRARSFQNVVNVGLRQAGQTRQAALGGLAIAHPNADLFRQTLEENGKTHTLFLLEIGGRGMPVISYS